MSTTITTERPDYGIDAPGVVRILTGGGFASLLAAVASSWSGVTWAAIILAPVAVVLLMEATLMMHNSWRGKFHHRDRILDHISWRGDERVLDVGTGRGLLLVGAAKLP
jgi:arsenite methyltransferase